MTQILDHLSEYIAIHPKIARRQEKTQSYTLPGQVCGDTVVARDTRASQVMHGSFKALQIANEDEGERGEPGQKERDLADREISIADQESQGARSAFESGNKALARQVQALLSIIPRLAKL